MSTKCISWFVGIVLIGTSWTVQAGTVIVSGDDTPVFYLTDTFPNSATAGNQQFFTNVLSGGTQVAVLDSSFNPFAGPEIDEFYDSLGGVVSTLFTGTVTVSDLAGVDLFLVPVPSDAFSISEITAISNFVTGGGTVFLMGEALDALGASTNGFINSVLSGLGSGLSLINANLDLGPQVATGNQITVHPLTTGVSAYNYGLASGVRGGTPLFFTMNGTPFVAIEGVVVPEPATVTLLTCGLGVIGMMRLLQRRHRK